MDYKKAYKAALESATQWIKDGCTDKEKICLESCFSELRESDDKMIWREIIGYLTHRADVTAIVDETKDCEKWIAYLEKQKEQKPIPDWMPKFLDELRSKKNYFDWDEHRDIEGQILAIINWIAPNYFDRKEKEHKPILEVFGFKVGDAVRLKDGDGRKHIIKSFEDVKGIHGPNFYHVEFEDNSAVDGIYPGTEYPNGYYTHMEKFEEVQEPVSGSSEKPNYHAEWSEEDETLGAEEIPVCTLSAAL